MKNMKLDWPWLGSKFLVILPILVAIYAIMWGYWVLTGTGLLDRSGCQIGGDFSHYWVAASLARTGEATAVYDVSYFKAAQEAIFKVKTTLAWFYPPTFLLMVTPLSLLPYLVSLAVWIIVTLGAYLVVIRQLAPDPRTIWLTLAFPGTFVNFGYGQNGFISGALLGGGLLLLDKFPVAAGVLLGLLTYKPHLAALVPLALIAGRRWRALIAMLAAAAALMLASLLVLGREVWLAFFQNAFLSFRALETGRISETTILPLFKMAGVFTAVQLAGGNLFLAAIIQGAVMLAVAVLVARVWSRGAPLALRSAVLVLGILLFTPYVFVYDLAILALPLAWLGWEGHTRGWSIWEKILFVLGWVTPLVAPLVAKHTQVQPAPLILGGLLFLAWRRTLSESPSAFPARAQKPPGVAADLPAASVPHLLGSKEHP